MGHAANYDNFYQNLEEARFRLEGTVVTYDKEPAFIHRVQEHSDGILRLKISILPYDMDRDMGGADVQDEEDDVPARGARMVRKKINSPKFNHFRPFKMGFCNYFRDNEQAKYLSRVPARRSKQGLDNGGLSVDSIRGPLRGLIGLNQLMSDEAFREMILGEYPSFDEAMDTLSRDRLIGVSYEFGINEDEIGMRYLYHKTEKVGLVRNGQVLLSQRKIFLREAIINCATLPNNVDVL